MKPRNEKAIVATLPKGLRAKDRIEQRRATREPAGRVEEDGSYRTRGGLVYDPDTGTTRRRVFMTAKRRTP